MTPLDSDRPAIAEFEEGRNLSLHRLRDQHRARLGELLEPRREIRRVADGGVLHAEVVADRADHHRSRMDPHPHLKIGAVGFAHFVAQRLEGSMHRESGRHRATRRVLEGDRGAEERHHAVAGELVDGSLVLVHLVEDGLDAAVDDLPDPLRIGRFGEGGEPHHVHEHDRDVFAFPLEGIPRGQDPLGEVLGRELAGVT